LPQTCQHRRTQPANSFGRIAMQQADWAMHVSGDSRYLIWGVI
jgi:hypothetical protein